MRGSPSQRWVIRVEMSRGWELPVLPRKAEIPSVYPFRPVDEASAAGYEPYRSIGQYGARIVYTWRFFQRRKLETKPLREFDLPNAVFIPITEMPRSATSAPSWTGIKRSSELRM